MKLIIFVLFLLQTITFFGMIYQNEHQVKTLLEKTPCLVTFAKNLQKKHNAGSIERDESDVFLKFDFVNQNVQFFQKIFFPCEIFRDRPTLTMNISHFCSLADAVDQKK